MAPSLNVLGCSVHASPGSLLLLGGGQSFCTQKAAAELQGDKIGVKKDLRGADISQLPPNFPSSLLLSGWPHFEPHLCLLTHFAYGLQHPKLEKKKRSVPLLRSTEKGMLRDGGSAQESKRRMKS